MPKTSAINKTKAKGGRPTRYRATLVNVVFWMARAGRTDLEIAEELKVSDRTLYRWKDKYPEFCQAIKRGKEEPDDQVEQSLFKRALGYEYEEIKIVALGGSPRRIEKTKKHIYPEVTACIFWLKNRRPEKWRDRHDLEHGGSVTIILPEGMDNA